ncbi:ACL-9 protein [Aphelenchoides avenae]|nr:ACL-9 protein [Aphelenchus avenae]
MAEPPTLTTSTWADKLKGFAFSMAMLLSAFYGCVYVLMPLVPLIFLRPAVFRRLVDRLIGFWLVMPSGIVEYLFGVDFTVTGDVIDHSKPSLIIMNHRTRLDWLFFWNALFRMDPWLLTSEKISLKGILKYLPGAGWAMASNAYMFLDRAFHLDKSRIEDQIDYYANSNNYQLLLYPEGTDKCPLATARSKRFAEKNGLVHYDYVLHPRTTGFTHILRTMREAAYVEYIYDVTVAYADAIVQSEVDLVTLGLCPKKVHFDIRRIPVRSIPHSEDDLADWLKKLWMEKEERLRQFYSQPEPSRKLDTLPGANLYELSPQAKFMQLAIVAVWSMLTASWIYFYFTYPYQGYAALVTIAFFVGAQYYYGGVELLLAQQSKKLRTYFKKKLAD